MPPKKKRKLTRRGVEKKVPVGEAEGGRLLKGVPVNGGVMEQNDGSYLVDGITDELLSEDNFVDSVMEDASITEEKQENDSLGKNFSNESQTMDTSLGSISHIDSNNDEKQNTDSIEQEVLNKNSTFDSILNELNEEYNIVDIASADVNNRNTSFAASTSDMVSKNNSCCRLELERLEEGEGKIADQSALRGQATVGKRKRSYDSKKHTCEWCGRIFARPGRMQVHINQKHMIIQQQYPPVNKNPCGTDQEGDTVVDKSVDTGENADPDFQSPVEAELDEDDDDDAHQTSSEEEEMTSDLTAFYKTFHHDEALDAHLERMWKECNSSLHRELFTESLLVTGKVMDGKYLMYLSFQHRYTGQRNITRNTTSFLAIKPPSYFTDSIYKALCQQKNKNVAKINLDSLHYVLHKSGTIALQLSKPYDCVDEHLALQRFSEKIKITPCLIFENKELMDFIFSLLLQYNFFLCKQVGTMEEILQLVPDDKPNENPDPSTSMDSPWQQQQHQIKREDKDVLYKRMVKYNSNDNILLSSLELDRPRLMSSCLRNICLKFDLHPEKTMKKIDLFNLSEENLLRLKSLRVKLRTIEKASLLVSPSVSVSHGKKRSRRKQQLKKKTDKSTKPCTVGEVKIKKSASKPGDQILDASQEKSLGERDSYQEKLLEGHDSSQEKSQNECGSYQEKSLDERDSNQEKPFGKHDRTQEKSLDDHDSSQYKSQDDNGGSKKKPLVTQESFQQKSLDAGLDNCQERPLEGLVTAQKKSCVKLKRPRGPTAAKDKKSANRQRSFAEEEELFLPDQLAGVFRVLFRAGAQAKQQLNFDLSLDPDQSLSKIGLQKMIFISATYFQNGSLKSLSLARYLPPDASSADLGPRLETSFRCIKPSEKSTMREEETEQADLRFPCETLETVLNRMLLEINDCNCVVFCSAFEGAKFIRFLNTSALNEVCRNRFKSKMQHLTYLKHVIKRCNLALPDLFLQSPLLQHILEPSKSGFIHRTAALMLKCFAALIKQFKVNFDHIILDPDVLWNLYAQNTRVKQDSSYTAILRAQPSSPEILRTERAQTNRINLLPSSSIVLDAVFYKSVSIKSGEVSSRLMNIGFCLDTEDEGQTAGQPMALNKLFLPINPVSRQAAESLGYTLFEGRYFYDGVPCYSICSALAIMYDLLSKFRFVFVKESQVLLQLMEIQNTIENSDYLNKKRHQFVRGRYFQAASTISRDYLNIAIKNFLPEKKERSDQIATKLHFVISDIIQFSSENNEFKLPVHPIGILIEKYGTSILPENQRTQYVTLEVQGSPQDCATVQRVIERETIKECSDSSENGSTSHEPGKQLFNSSAAFATLPPSLSPEMSSGKTIVVGINDVSIIADAPIADPEELECKPDVDCKPLGLGELQASTGNGDPVPKFEPREVKEEQILLEGFEPDIEPDEGELEKIALSC